MKKVSTAGAKQSRKSSGQQRTIGLDRGDRNSWYCVLDPAGQVRVEQRIRTTGKGLREVFGSLPRSRVALETGTLLEPYRAAGCEFVTVPEMMGTAPVVGLRSSAR